MIPIKPVATWLVAYSNDKSQFRLFGSFMHDRWIYLQFNPKNIDSSTDLFNASIIASDADILEVISNKLRFAEDDKLVQFLETAYDYVSRGQHTLDASENPQT